MKITFLDYELTEAQIARGFWRWKRRALVHQTSINGTDVWTYSVSGAVVEQHIEQAIAAARNREADRQQEEQDWQPIRALPVARRVKT